MCFQYYIKFCRYWKNLWVDDHRHHWSQKHLKSILLYYCICFLFLLAYCIVNSFKPMSIRRFLLVIIIIPGHYLCPKICNPFYHTSNQTLKCEFYLLFRKKLCYFCLYIWLFSLFIILFYYYTNIFIYWNLMNTCLIYFFE